MSATKKKIKVYSILLLILATVSLLDCLITYAKQDYSASGIAVDATLGSLMNVMVGFSIGMAVISALIKVYFAVKGFREIKGTNKGLGYVTFSYVVLAYYLVSLGSGLYTGIKGSGFDAAGICTSAANALILFDYARSCKDLREEHSVETEK